MKTELRGVVAICHCDLDGGLGEFSSVIRRHLKAFHCNVIEEMKRRSIWILRVRDHLALEADYYLLF